MKTLLLRRDGGSPHRVCRSLRWLMIAVLAGSAGRAFAVDTLLRRSAFFHVGAQTQTYTVPDGANYVVISAWGGGGGGAEKRILFQTHQIAGGQGTGVTAKLAVQSGDQFTISVGGGGKGTLWNVSQATPGAWPGGGDGAGGGGGGGGYTRVQTAYGDIWAGGGGGGGGHQTDGDGGNAGYPTGANASLPGGGYGGTLTAGGSGSGSGSAGQGGHVSGLGGSGGGGGYFGGGAGTSRGGGGGSSQIIGPFYDSELLSSSMTWSSKVPRPAPEIARGGYDDTSSVTSQVDGRPGAVVIDAYRSPGGVPAFTFLRSDVTQVYTVPSYISSLTVKAWGGGGPSSATAAGGAGAFISASFAVTPGQTVSIEVSRGNTYGTLVTLPSGTKLFAGGGGAAGEAPGGQGGNAGAPNGGNGGGGYGNVGGGGGTTAGSGASTHGVGGSGGSGNGYITIYDGEDPVGYEDVGIGEPGSTNEPTGGGSGGLPGEADPGYEGGRGGGGLGGGGGGGGGANNAGGGGGGGGSSGVTYSTLAPSNLTMQAGNGTVAPAANDTHYPGGNIGAGAPAAEPSAALYGGQGAVVIIPHTSTPVITSTLTQNLVRYQAVDYTITATFGPTSYAATGLPPGLAVNPSTGKITGRPTATGTINTTISATNRAGTGQATLSWNISADSTAPTAPSTVQAANITQTSLMLSWTASTDTAGTATYEIECDGLSRGTSATPNFNISGLSPSTTYAIRVRASDPSGNWSAWSSSVNVATSAATPQSADTTAPTTPAGLNYADRTAKAIVLIWSSATDNVGVTHYAVYRGGTLLGVTSDLTFTDTGLTASTSYTYTVKAADGAGNFSSATSGLTVGTTADFSLDTDQDGVPDAAETVLGTNGSATGDNDATNQTKQNFHRPIP